MISAEPLLNVGILDGAARVTGSFEGEFRDPKGHVVTGAFHCAHADQQWTLELGSDTFRFEGAGLTFAPVSNVSAVRIDDVTIGVNFHWERKEPQLFKGALRLLQIAGKGITVINQVPLEEYLKSVISSEMSATAPAELLRAHAITSRSWLVAMLERSRQQASPPHVPSAEERNEVVRWYTREDHAHFDVCADDHCQRYQGITKIISRAAEEAIQATRGQFLVYENEICDARFYKACGGRTEEFPSAWEPKDVPYLRSVSDSQQEVPPVRTEEEMDRWILNPPDAYCNTTDAEILRKILPSFDQETTDFFRWTVEYSGDELSALVRRKSGIDFGRLRDLVPEHRGPSGRITAMRIVGEKRTVTVGKELEIRRWLSPSHLYSSAFLVRILRDHEGFAREVTLDGAGWGHGVGLCQIGAAVMATQGKSAAEIVLHYFRGASLRTLY
jgi:stage II sporulation protein D